MQESKPILARPMEIQIRKRNDIKQRNGEHSINVSKCLFKPYINLKKYNSTSYNIAHPNAHLNSGMIYIKFCTFMPCIVCCIVEIFVERKKRNVAVQVL